MRTCAPKYLDVTVDDEAAQLSDWLPPRLEEGDLVGLRTEFLTLAGTEMIVPVQRQVLERDGCVSHRLGI